MRRKATFVNCDNPDCPNIVEAPGEDDKHVPCGWYVAAQADEKDSVLAALRNPWTFCSVVCIAAWAVERDDALKEVNGGKLTRTGRPA